jgi:hypothetical protein
MNWEGVPFMNNEENVSFDTEEKVEGEEKIEEYAYKNVITKNSNTRLFSVISVAFAALSVILSFVPWVGLILGLVSVGFSLISRKKLGYFEVLALVGLIVGIFGFVFSSAGIILSAVFANSGYFSFWSLLFGGVLM